MKAVGLHGTKGQQDQDGVGEPDKQTFWMFEKEKAAREDKKTPEPTLLRVELEDYNIEVSVLLSESKRNAVETSIPS